MHSYAIYAEQDCVKVCLHTRVAYVNRYASFSYDNVGKAAALELAISKLEQFFKEEWLVQS